MIFKKALTIGPAPNPECPDDVAATEDVAAAEVAVGLDVAVGVLVPAAVSAGKFSSGLNSIVAFVVYESCCSKVKVEF